MVHEKAITLIRDTATINDNAIFLFEASSNDPRLPRTTDGGVSPLQERNRAKNRENMNTTLHHYVFGIEQAPVAIEMIKIQIQEI